MIYKIVNMSDPYTIECPDLEIATVCCVLLGRGEYEFLNVTDPAKPSVPMFMFGSEEFSKEHFHGMSINRVVHLALANRPHDVANALDSVIIGDRKLYEKAVEFVKSELRKSFREQFHDQVRSSMNDIGRRAWQMAEDIRNGRLPLQPVQRQVFRSGR